MISPCQIEHTGEVVRAAPISPCAEHVAYGEVQSFDGHVTQLWQRKCIKNKIKRNKLYYLLVNVTT